MYEFKARVKAKLTNFMTSAIKNSTDYVEIPGGTAYISDNVDKRVVNGSTIETAYLLAWVVTPFLTTTLRIEQSNAGIVVKQQVEFIGREGQPVKWYRQVPKSQRAFTFFAEYQGQGMAEPLPKAEGSFYVNFQALGEHIANEYMENRELKIDHAAYGITPTTDEEVAARRAARQAERTAATAPTAEAPVAEAQGAAATEKPKATRQRRSLRTKAETKAEEAPVVNEAAPDYDPFAGLGVTS